MSRSLLIVSDYPNKLNPENKPLMDQYSFSATPELYLVDEQGQIIGFWDGFAEEEVLRQAFEAALNK